MGQKSNWSKTMNQNTSLQLIESQASLSILLTKGATIILVFLTNEYITIPY